jgi:8-oxoguanine deaminase
MRWATQGSARCLGRTDIGVIAVGKQAGFALFTLDELRFSGGHDTLATLILCGGHSADRVKIAGQWWVVDGQPLGLDLARLRAAHGKAATKFL